MYKYAPNVNIIHCPADIRINYPATDVRCCFDTYSGMSWLNAPADFPTNYLKKRGQLLTPAMRFLYAEGDDLRGSNIGSWGFRGGTAANYFTDSTWWDSPAAFHAKNSATWSFADGHAELHRWQNGATIAFALDQTPQKDGVTVPTYSAANLSKDDLAWVGMRYPSPPNP